ncbi:hypothetical protein Pssp01_14150 [Pseudomonas sp. NBRC 100443]|nr:hypothetical protein Pssp01_14150 [Pseudomonas sp. NBRC 100443]
MPGPRSHSLEQLNRQRLRAVELRLAGQTLKNIAASTGLSAPTIIAAYKAYLAGGWAAVPAKPRGRQAGDGRVLGAQQEAELLELLTSVRPDDLDLPFLLWQMEALQALAEQRLGLRLPARTASHYLQRWQLNAPKPAQRMAEATPAVRRWYANTYPEVRNKAREEGGEIFWVDDVSLRLPTDQRRLGLMRCVSNRGHLRWMTYEGGLRAPYLIDFFSRLMLESGCKVFILFEGMHWQRAATFGAWLGERASQIQAYHLPDRHGMAWAAQSLATQLRPTASAPNGESRPTGPWAEFLAKPLVATADPMLKMLRVMLKLQAADTPPTASPYVGKKPRQREERTMALTHLQRLEAESIHAMREVIAEADNPAMLYSVGKDSAVMLHLAMKAFYPAKPPFPLLHVDTTWKFQEMYRFRDQMVSRLGVELLVHVNQEGLEMGINPFSHGSQIHTDVMKTQALKQALDHHGFDVVFGGARRDEEKSRAKERIFSFRSAQHRWDPKNQRPELWHLYNARKHKGESIRVFPLSNWTELDIWQYIHLENVPIVPLYFSAMRPVVERDGALIMVDDERMPLRPGEVPMMRSVRFRTLGCYPLTGAVESTADTLPAIIQEMLLTRTSERQGRVIDHDAAASMEKKKQEGYF